MRRQAAVMSSYAKKEPQRKDRARWNVWTGAGLENTSTGTI